MQQKASLLSVLSVVNCKGLPGYPANFFLPDNWYSMIQHKSSFTLFSMNSSNSTSSDPGRLNSIFCLKPLLSGSPSEVCPTLIVEAVVSRKNAFAPVLRTKFSLINTPFSSGVGNVLTSFNRKRINFAFFGLVRPPLLFFGTLTGEYPTIISHFIN